ncbi:MAG TPA: 50S ribosomal protein L21 [Vicinamibacteria bacterium]|nr:50S ribosomal protein L21 [Vicinamibacteria bacterium]
MYAIIETGGKQHRAVPGEPLRVERLEAESGETVRFDKVLLVSRDGEVSLGSPYVDGASVVATVTGQERAPKILVFKKKRRKGYRRTRGHRQAFTALRIESIEG